MENFVILEEICRTQFSTILKCKNKKLNEIVILKQIASKKIESSPSKEVYRELLIIMNFKHDNIISFISVFVNKTYIVIEMEYCITSLSNIINQICKPFHIAQVKKIIRSIAEGLKYLHDNDIMHRDIKPGNIFIDNKSNIKIGDFGSSRIINDKISSVTPNVGTKWYKAPEIILGKKNYGKYVDIWSFGCLIAEIFLLQPLFPGNTDFEMINLMAGLGFTPSIKQIFNLELEFMDPDPGLDFFEKNFDNAGVEAIDLLKNMLVLDHNKRIRIDEVLQHPFLNKNNEEYMHVCLPL